MRRSRAATAGASLAGVGGLLVAMGPTLTHLAETAPMTGFNLFMLGGLFCLCGMVLGLMGLYRTRPATGLSGRGLALLGALVGAAGFVVLLTPALEASSYPPINDITTNPQDPPLFVAAGERDMSYPGGEFAKQQAQAYPDLAPLDLALSPADAYQAALAGMEALELQVTHRDPVGGSIEGYAVTSVFRFVDDVAIRIRPTAQGSRIDLRSKSRDGQGDLGANALRIRSLAQAIRDASLRTPRPSSA